MEPDVREVIVRMVELLVDVALSSHKAHKVISKGTLHPGDWRACDSMQCQDVRAEVELVNRFLAKAI